MSTQIFKKQLPLILTSGAIIAILASCSTEGGGGLGTTRQTIIFSTAEQGVIAAIPDPTLVKPCQGVPESGMTWPKEFLYTCHTYDGSLFANGFSADNSGFTLTAPYNCSYSNYAADYSTASIDTAYTNTIRTSIENELKKSYYDSGSGKGVFQKLTTIYPRLRTANYQISFGGLFEIKTHTNGKKYLKLLTPIVRDFTSYQPNQPVDTNPLLLGDDHTYHAISLTNNANEPITGPFVDMNFGLSGISILTGVPFPLAVDGDSSETRRGQGMGAASFNLASTEVNQVMKRFVYTTYLNNYDYAIGSVGLSMRVDRHLCSFVVNDKFYKVKKDDFNAFAQTFNIDLTQLSVDAAGNITIALPTLYYTTQFKPRTVVSDQVDYSPSPNPYADFKTKSTSMSPIEGSEFTSGEFGVPTADETSYANLLENTEAGTSKKALPEGFTAASAP